MPRPKSKDELLALCEENYRKLNDYINSLPPAKISDEFPPGTMNRNIRDVLAHLYHWHLMFLQWYEEGMAGKKPAMPAEGYSWKTIPALNRKIWEKYRECDLDDVQKKFEASHTRVQELIAKHSNEELFEKKRYPWTGSTSLGAYLISATSSHYDWAMKLIKKATKIR